LAYRFTGRREEAEELTHEIIIQVYRRLDRFDPRAHFAVWLNSVARNFCIDRYRMRVRERQRMVRGEFSFDRVVTSRRKDPYRLYQAQEMRESFRSVLATLSPKLGEVVRLRFLEELAYEEIAERLGVPEGTVKSRIHRGRAKLRQHFVAARAQKRGAKKRGGAQKSGPKRAQRRS